MAELNKNEQSSLDHSEFSHYLACHIIFRPCAIPSKNTDAFQRSDFLVQRQWFASGVVFGVEVLGRAKRDPVLPLPARRCPFTRAYSTKTQSAYHSGSHVMLTRGAQTGMSHKQVVTL